MKNMALALALLLASAMPSQAAAWEVQRKSRVPITITAADEGSGLASVVLFISGAQKAEWLGDPLANGSFVYGWRVPAKKNCTYLWCVRVEDLAGNSQSVCREVTAR